MDVTNKEVLSSEIFNLGIKISFFGDIDKEYSDLTLFLKAHEVFGRYANGILPSQRGSGVELDDYRWIAKIRNERDNLDELPELNKIAAYYGSPDAFVPDGRYDCKLQSINRAHDVFNKLKLLGRKFSHNTEYKEYMWIATIKMAKKGTTTSNNRYYPELDEIATSYGFGGIFDIIDKKKISMIKNLRRIFEQYKLTGKLPVSKSKDGKFLRQRRESKREYPDTWHAEFDNIAAEYGVGGIFDYGGLKTKRLL